MVWVLHPLVWCMWEKFCASSFAGLTFEESFSAEVMNGFVRVLDARICEGFGNVMGSFVCFFMRGFWIFQDSHLLHELQWWWIRFRQPCEGLFCKIINFSAIMIHVACFFGEDLEFVWIHIYYTFNLFICMKLHLHV